MSLPGMLYSAQEAELSSSDYNYLAKHHVTMLAVPGPMSIVIGQKKKRFRFRSPDRPYQNKAYPTFSYAILKILKIFLHFFG